MHYEEELDLFCSWIRANITIMLHKTIYEINSTLLLTSNHHQVVYCSWNMLFIAFYIAAQISISDVHIHLKKLHTNHIIS